MPDTDTPAIHIRDLRKTYRGGKRSGPKEALKGVDLTIPRGAFFALLGPNGAGKSTLINILAGLVMKSSGQAAICGYDLDTQVRQARLSIGVVPQELVIDSFFTVREMLEFHAGYYGVPKARRRTDAIIEALGLTDKADVNTRQLSGGMRRRLLVGKALVHAPDVLILDEPTAGVDVELRQQLWDYVRELNRQGTTVLLTTHYLEEAEELCDTIAIINHGELIACDSKTALMARMDRKTLTLTLDAPLTDVPPALADFDARIGEHGALVVDYRPSVANVSELLSIVCDHGYTIRDLATREADLEDIFRHLTRAGDGGSEAALRQS